MKTYNHSVQVGTSAYGTFEAASQPLFVTVLVATTVGLVFLQPSMAVSAAAAVCLSLAMIGISIHAVIEPDAGSRKAIAVMGPVFSGLVIWLAALTAQIAGGGFAALATAALVIPAIILAEGMVSILLIGAVSRVSDRPVDSAAAVLVAEKYSGLAGSLR